MHSMQASSWLHKVEVARAETMVVEAIREPDGVIRLAKVNRLIIRVRINPHKSSRWWCKHSSKAVARRASNTMMVIKLWREPDTKCMTMHLRRGWDLGHWIRMINVSG